MHFGFHPSGHAPPRRIAVFRALPPADLLSAVPALRALRRAAPDSHITLVGKASASDFAHTFRHYIDDLMVFPCLPGYPLHAADPALLPAFYHSANARRFDMALQLHDGDDSANEVVSRLGARCWAGFLPASRHMAKPPRCDVTGPSLLIPWPTHLPDALRYTTLIEHLGIDIDSTELEYPLNSNDYEKARELFWANGLNPQQTIVIHPAHTHATTPWPVRRWAELATALSAQGWQIAIAGGKKDHPLTSRLRQIMRSVSVDLTGYPIGEMIAFFAQCRLLIGNDKGISHMAAAVRTPSIVIASGNDINSWAPPDRELHTIVWQPYPKPVHTLPEAGTDLYEFAGPTLDVAQVLRHVNYKLSLVGAFH